MLESRSLSSAFFPERLQVLMVVVGTGSAPHQPTNAPSLPHAFYVNTTKVNVIS
jgi:hypothetical protein